MKILLSTYSLAFQNPGGGEQVLLSLSRELAALGHQVDLFNPWRNDPANYDVIHYFSCTESSFWNHAKKRAPEVPLLVTPTLFQRRNWGAVLASAKRAALRLVGDRLGEELNRWQRYDLPDLWLPSTSAEAEALSKYWQIPREKIRVLPNGVESRFADAKPEAFARDTKIRGPFVLHVGRFHPVKNHETLIKAVRIARAHCVFIGDPDLGHEPYYSRCVAAAREAERTDPRKLTKFTFIPALQHEDPILASAYSAASVLALPSHFETFGLTAIEAALAGTRLVLTRNILSAEIFSPFAALVDPGDPKEIAEALRRSLSQEQESEPRSARIARLSRYFWPNIAMSLVDLYQAALRARGSRSRP